MVVSADSISMMSLPFHFLPLESQVKLRESAACSVNKFQLERRENRSEAWGRENSEGAREPMGIKSRIWGFSCQEELKYAGFFMQK